MANTLMNTEKRRMLAGIAAREVRAFLDAEPRLFDEERTALEAAYRALYKFESDGV